MADGATAAPRVAFRARIVLRASEGQENRSIARDLRTSPGTIARWRARFLMQRIPGIERDAPRPGRPPVVPTSTIQLIVRRGHARSFPGTRRPSSRKVAQELGVSKTTVLRVWNAHRVPALPRPGSAPLEPSPEFADKVTDFVGLYLNPPQRALAFSVDERARTRAGARRTGGPAEAIPGLDQAEEFRKFLQGVDRETPKELDVHVLVDSRVTPTLPEIRRWLVRHPRFYLRLLPPTGTSPNLIDRLLSGFTAKRVRPGTPESAVRLRGAVQRYLTSLPRSSGPFVWTASSEEIRSRSGMRPNTIGYYWTKT